MAEDAEDASEAADAEGDGEEAPKKSSKMKLLLFAGLPAVILVLAGVTGALMLMGGGGDDETEYAEGAEAADAEPPPPEQKEYHFEDPLRVNINSGGDRMTLLQMEVVLLYTDPEVPYLLGEREDHIFDAYVGFLRELRVEDLSGAAGLHRLRLELVRRANLELAPHHIDGVLIPEILMQ